jgi:acyl carrier protein
MANSDTSDIEQTISRLVSEELKLPMEELKGDTNLRELPGVESIRVLRIIARLERAYDVELEDELVFRVQTLGELADAIRKLRGTEKVA